MSTAETDLNNPQVSTGGEVAMQDKDITPDKTEQQELPIVADTGASTEVPSSDGAQPASGSANGEYVEPAQQELPESSDADGGTAAPATSESSTVHASADAPKAKDSVPNGTHSSARDGAVDGAQAEASAANGTAPEQDPSRIKFA